MKSRLHPSPRWAEQRVAGRNHAPNGSGVDDSRDGLLLGQPPGQEPNASCTLLTKDWNRIVVETLTAEKISVWIVRIQERQVAKGTRTAAWRTAEQPSR
ncbi:MAG: hypothetical protein ABGY32_13310, partial [bacterium]